MYKVSDLHLYMSWLTTVQIVLVFLVCLQLANFFCLASNVLWLSKICEGIIAELSVYTALYGVTFLVNIVVSTKSVMRSIKLDKAYVLDPSALVYHGMFVPSVVLQVDVKRDCAFRVGFL